MLPYCKEVMKRTDDVLKKHYNKEDSTGKAKIKKFETVFNDNFNDKNEFKKIYEETLQEFIQHLNDLYTIEKGNVNKDFLLTVRFAYICKDPYKVFMWDYKNQAKCTDFHKFYELYDNIEEENLKQEVDDLLK